MNCIILALSLVFLSVSSEQINITNEYDLETFLCNKTHSLDDDTLLVLSDNTTHLISNNVSFCVINTTYSLTLTSGSSKQALIKCNDSSILPNSGFAFTNIHNLTLIRLVFTGCGEQLKRLAVMESINSSVSPMHFSQYHSAVLLFLHINTLLIDEVNITKYYGFAIFAMNPMNASINKCNISVSNGKKGDTHQKDFGSGVLILFTDIIGVPSHGNCNVIIHQSRLSNNSDSYQSKTNSICDAYSLHNQEHLPIFNAAGLSILYLQNKFVAHTQVMQSTFFSNHGLLAGAVLVIYYNSINQSQVVISNATFKRNFSKNKCPGSNLLFIFYASNTQSESHYLFPLYVLNSNFSDHFSSIATKGIIYLYIYNLSKNTNVTLIFSQINFKSVFTSGTGSCLHAVSNISGCSNNKKGSAQIILRDINAVRNIQFHAHELFAIVNFDYIFLNGISSYTNNYGSVFGISNTKVILGGQLHFENNTGDSGSAFLLTGSSRFILQEGLNATFIHNVAFTNGGAIYAYNSITSECMFTPINGSDVTMLFIDNSAVYSGNSIFSNNLYSCSTMNKFDAKVAKKLYYKLSQGTLFNSTEKQLSTVPFKQVICYHDSSRFMNDSNDIVVYPGMMLHFPMAVHDAFNQSTRSDVSLNFVRLHCLNTIAPQYIPSENWYITPNSITLSEKNCKMVNVTILKRTENDGPFLWLNLLMSISQVSLTSMTHIIPKGCPFGFVFNTSTHKCECSHVLHKIDHQPICIISSDGYNPLITITLAARSLSNWIGTVNNGTVFGVSSDCYIYCRYENNHNAFVINDSVSVMIADSSNYDNKVSLCSNNREGPLCSQCIPGYSVTFGSDQCAKCSNWWLLTLIVYGLAGPLLIYLLYALKLTLTTGKLNGIIFYTQIMNINVSVFYHTVIGHKVGEIFRSFVTGVLFLLSLNINFSIPLCFYDGMTELWKTGLGLLFPVYLLSIVIGLIVISRYSVRLSNRIANSSVQVLVTVVHLSFSTLLLSAFNVFTPVYIYTNTSDVPLVVWQNDGTVEYGKGGHLILMIVTGLTVGPILTTYLTVLLAGRLLMKINRIREYLRPIYEAIHAPYKQNREFIFSFSIIFIAFTFLLSTLFIGANQTLGLVIGISAICLYLNIVGFSHPFKRMSLNALNIFIHSIIIILSCSIWSTAVASVEWAILITFSHLTVVIILICVIMSQFSFWKKLFNKILAFSINNVKVDRPPFQQKSLTECSSFYRSCKEREPLLNS